MSSKEQDPLDPQNDIFWDGPDAIRKKLRGNVDSETTKTSSEPYRLKPPTPTPPSSDVSSQVVPNCSTTLKRCAGPDRPNTPGSSEPELSEPEAKRLKEVEAEINAHNEKYARGESSFKEQLYSFSDLSKEDFESEFHF